METVSLRVTAKVMAQVSAESATQRQIAMRYPSEGLSGTINALGHGKRVALRLGEFFTVVVGDTGAIWGTHNVEHSWDFEALYSLLACRPDEEMVMVARVVG